MFYIGARQTQNKFSVNGVLTDLPAFVKGC